jgi:hypothetical protein
MYRRGCVVNGQPFQIRTGDEDGPVCAASSRELAGTSAQDALTEASVRGLARSAFPVQGYRPGRFLLAVGVLLAPLAQDA